MGLSRCICPFDRPANGSDNNMLHQRQQLFWVLYCLDKQRVFLTGHPCELYLFDSDFLQPKGDDSNDDHHTPPAAASQLQAALIHLMTIWEGIYIGLYSSRAAGLGDQYRHDQMTALLCQLEVEWMQQHERVYRRESLLEQAPELDLLQLEIRYCYNVAKILIYRCDRSTGSQQRCREQACLALQTISEVFREPITTSSCAVLGR